MNIKIFVTGGTFDKEYNELNGELFFKETHLPEMLKLGRCKLNVEVETLMMIDSLYMTDEKRGGVLQMCQDSAEDKIVITHGTDTMVETAKFLANSEDLLKKKTVILTGAMIPYKFGSSDGLFNLGTALAFVQVLPAGIYVAMNGKYFDYHKVRKNKELGEFEEV
ncbi:MAG: asparaginase domain-containing protein [Patescibacteria group bacterium]